MKPTDNISTSLTDEMCNLVIFMEFAWKSSSVWMIRVVVCHSWFAVEIKEKASSSCKTGTSSVSCGKNNAELLQALPSTFPRKMESRENPNLLQTSRYAPSLRAPENLWGLSSSAVDCGLVWVCVWMCMLGSLVSLDWPQMWSRWSDVWISKMRITASITLQQCASIFL